MRGCSQVREHAENPTPCATCLNKRLSRQVVFSTGGLQSEGHTPRAAVTVAAFFANDFINARFSQRATCFRLFFPNDFSDVRSSLSATCITSDLLDKPLSSRAAIGTSDMLYEPLSTRVSSSTND